MSFVYRVISEELFSNLAKRGLIFPMTENVEETSVEQVTDLNFASEIKENTENSETTQENIETEQQPGLEPIQQHQEEIQSKPSKSKKFKWVSFEKRFRFSK